MSGAEGVVTPMSEEPSRGQPLVPSHVSEPLTITPPPPSQPQPQHRPLPANLDQMTMGQLREYAQAEEIDLTGATKREDVLKVIRKA